MVQTAIDGKFDGSKYDGKYRGGLKEGVVDIAPFGKSVSEDTQTIDEIESMDYLVDGVIGSTK